MSTQSFLAGAALVGAALLGGCATNPSLAIFHESGSQLQTRSFQTRAFDTADREQTLRAVIATMQDLGFVIDKADATLGSVSGTKLALYELRLTVTVRAQGPTRLLVRANAQYAAGPNATAVAVENPSDYRDFFTALAKSLFLEAQEVG